MRQTNGTRSVPLDSTLDAQAVRDIVAEALVDSLGNTFPYDGDAGKLTISTSGSPGGGDGPTDPTVYAIRETFASEAPNAAISAFETGGAFDGALRLQKVGSSPFARDTVAGFATAPSHEKATIEALLRYDGPVDPSHVSLVDMVHSLDANSGFGDNHYWIRVLYSGGGFLLQVYQKAMAQDYEQFSQSIDVVPGDPFRISIAFAAPASGPGLDMAGFYRKESDSAWTAAGTAHTPYPFGDHRSGFKREDLNVASEWARGDFKVVNA